MISFKRLGKSFAYAWTGLREVYAREQNFRVHLLATIALAAAIILLGITGAEAAVLILVAAAVLVLELANSIFERFLDIVSPRVGAQVRDAKDIMAATVLIASIAALVIAAIIIIPHL